jgi:hypothetical protein
MGWGEGVCARVLLRRELQREPTRLEVDEAILIITADDVKGAYFSGKEVWIFISYANILIFRLAFTETISF